MLSVTLFTFFALLATALLLLYLHFRKQYRFWKRKNVFFIEPKPLVGNFLPVLLLKKSLGTWIWDIYNQVKDKDFFGIYAFDKPFLVVRSPELIKLILVKQAENFQTRERTIADNDELIQNILFLSTNNRWKHMRSKVTPVFSSGKLKMMYTLLLQQTADLVDYLKATVPVENIDIEEVAKKYTTNCIARCAFGVKANCFQREDAEFRLLGKEMFEFRPSLAFRQTSTLFIPAAVKLLGLKFWPESTIQKLRNIFQSVLNERSKMASLKGNDLVDMLLKIRKQDDEFTDNVLLGHAIQFFAAGFETTAGTLAHSMFELAVNVDIQERLRGEILETLEKHNSDCNLEAINDMKYLDMVVCEVLRKYPIIAILDRRCTKDFEVPNSGLVIPKGVPIIISCLGMHYDEKYFPDPDKFNPERFANKFSINENGLYYMPFGAGPRNCLGERFGRTVVKLGIINILSNFRLAKSKETPDKLEFEPTSVLLHSSVGVPIKMDKL